MNSTLRKIRFNVVALAGAAVIASSLATPAAAEGRISVAQQFGIGYLLLDVVKDQQLIEKHGKALGVDIKVEWAQISGATAMNEALLAGSLDVVSAGVPPMLTVWDRTKGRQNVKAVAALGSLPNYLITNNPQVRSLKDLSSKDRIAVPAAGTGFQSRVLQIETAKQFGKAEFKKFDEISISLPHPEATAALIAGGSEIDVHFSSAPFYYQALENPNVHKVISSYDILGGPSTFNVLYATQKFHDENPKTYKAFYDALVEAAQFVRANKAQAADTFIRVQKSRLSPEFVRKIVEDKENDFTVSPFRTFVFAEQLFQLGVIKTQAASWKDYFFEEAYAQPGAEVALATDSPFETERAAAAMLEVDQVSLEYVSATHRVRATHQVSFDVHEGDRYVLLGPSGCGKSTLLKAIGGFVHPVSGEIRLDGQAVREPGPDRVVVFQEFDQLPPWKTVKQNVMFPLQASRSLARRDIEARALHYLDKVGLSRFADAYPHTLSGGMKQRVAIARALAMQPRVLLMDEPFAALDALTRRKMQEELLALWDDARFTLVFVTHSIEEALVVGNRVGLLSPHPGRMRAEINADSFDLASQGSTEFQSAVQRIHHLLFDATPRLDEVDA